MEEPTAVRIQPSFNNEIYNDISIRQYKSSVKNIKILIFRDSFCSALIPFLTENFGESIFIRSTDFNRDIIMDVKPDIVLHEIVECNL